MGPAPAGCAVRRPAGPCVSQEENNAVRKAAALVALRLGGPDYPMVCARHGPDGLYVRCQRVAVARFLLDPTVTCGAA